MTKNRTSLALRLAAVAFLGAASLAHAQEPPMVGGAPMLPSLTIPENASKADNLTTLVAAVTAAGLVDTLASDGPFTVFAPTNAAFDKLPPGALQSLTQPENRDALTRILTYHVVSGRVSAADLGAQIDAGGGSATLTTVQGGTLTATRVNGAIRLTDSSGAYATVTTPDIGGSNGVIHVIDTVVTPPAA